MAGLEDPISGCVYMIDEAYEFSAPGFYDFMVGETEEEVRKAEMWFESACSYAPSPFMMRIKTGRSVKLDTVCDFSEGEQQIQKIQAPESSESKLTGDDIANESSLERDEQSRVQTVGCCMPTEAMKDITTNVYNKEPSPTLVNPSTDKKITPVQAVGAEVNTPAPQTNTLKTNSLKTTNSKKLQTARKIASLIKNPSELKSKLQLQHSQAKKPPTSVRRDNKVKSCVVETPNFIQENQAVKRQKLEGGKSRQIINFKPLVLPHKPRSGLNDSSSNLCPSTAKTRKEDRKMYVRETAAPFVSMAEMMKKFQSNTREMSLSRMSSSVSQGDPAETLQRKTKLKLTRPKEPEFETSQRVRSVKIKSSAELEEEMMVKMPKFKALPLNKKILEAPNLPAIPRSTPQVPVFKEFHLETMSRAHQTVETSTVASTESSQNNYQWNPHHLTAPKSPYLQTSLRARPPKIKSSEELEKEELEKIPKFKAKPLNKKIFESKGELTMFCKQRKQFTVPQEFHFAIDERIPPPPPPTNVADMFDKLSLHSEQPQHDKPPLPRNTTPQPFNLHTEERGVEKEKKLLTELLRKHIEEESARIPRAHPYPYTTDYPVVPPKPEPKPCTKPEPFELESLIRHEEEMQREMAERHRLEMEEAQRRLFKAQPILKEDPIPVPEKDRRPLTEVQEFNLHVDHRAVDRAEFDKKIKEKEMMYKRYREETESAKLMEEEKALKQLRRTLVPCARPVPNFNHPFLPQKSSKQVTKAKSPRLRIVKRKEIRTLVPSTCPLTTAASSSASQMR